MIKHPWILKHKEGCCKAEGEHDHESISREVILKLRKYRGESLLKRTAINILVKQMEPHQINSLKDEFQKLDTDTSGFLEKNELRDAINNSHYAIEGSEVDDIVNQLDLAQNGKINYSEFLSATIDLNEL